MSRPFPCVSQEGVHFPQEIAGWAVSVVSALRTRRLRVRVEAGLRLPPLLPAPLLGEPSFPVPTNPEVW